MRARFTLLILFLAHTTLTFADENPNNTQLQAKLNWVKSKIENYTSNANYNYFVSYDISKCELYIEQRDKTDSSKGFHYTMPLQAFKGIRTDRSDLEILTNNTDIVGHPISPNSRVATSLWAGIRIVNFTQKGRTFLQSMESTLHEISEIARKKCN